MNPRRAFTLLLALAATTPLSFAQMHWMRPRAASS